MRFEDIRGNDSVKQALTGMVRTGRIPHAIMFHEDDGGGAMAFCLAFLQLLIPSERVSKMIHLDVHYTFPVVGDSTERFLPEWRSLVLSNPNFTENQLSEALGFEGKNSLIAVSEAKAILDKLAFNSIEGGYRAIVVYLPEKMNAMAANKLLKAIEEPAEKTQFLLITHSPEKVLSTISSRCQNIRIRPEAKADVAEECDTAEYGGIFRALMDAVVAKDLSAALEAGEELAALPSREKAKSFCRYASQQMRQVFLIQQGLDSLGSPDGYARTLAAALKKTFPRKALEMLGRANLLIERNVNMKILFTDMVDRLYSNI